MGCGEVALMGLPDTNLRNSPNGRQGVQRRRGKEGDQRPRCGGTGIHTKDLRAFHQPTGHASREAAATDVSEAPATMLLYRAQSSLK